MKKTKKPGKAKAANKMVKRRPGKQNRGNRNPYQAHEAASKALQGNHYWKLRSKHGRDKLFSSPQELKEAAEEYFKSVDDNPDYRQEIKTERGKIKKIDVAVCRPYTLMGLCGYLDCSSGYFRTFKATCNSEKEKDFLAVIAYIEDRIYNQQFSKASNGFLNSNIIARALGLVDRQDVTTGDQPLTAPVINIFKGDTPPINEDEKSKRKSND